MINYCYNKFAHTVYYAYLFTEPQPNKTTRSYNNEIYLKYWFTEKRNHINKHS